MAKAKTLPDVPSKLLRLAIKDLMAVEADKKNYQINMGTWHDGGYDAKSKCTVCFAGAVMAKSLKVAKDDHADPEDFTDQEKLYFLDTARSGNVQDDEWISDLIGERAEKEADAALKKADAAVKNLPQIFRDKIADTDTYEVSDDIMDNLLNQVSDAAVVVPPYETSPAKFKKAILKLADNLEKIGF